MQALTTGTVRDLVAGSGPNFDDRGKHELEGLPAAWDAFTISANTPQ